MFSKKRDKQVLHVWSVTIFIMASQFYALQLFYKCAGHGLKNLYSIAMISLVFLTSTVVYII